MKAASAVLIQSQKQMTLLGLTIPLLAVICGVTAAAVAMTVVLDVVALLIPTACMTSVSLWVLCHRQMQANPFFDRELFVAGRFWAGKGKRRHLIAGGRA